MPVASLGIKRSRVLLLALLHFRHHHEKNVPWPAAGPSRKVTEVQQSHPTKPLFAAQSSPLMSENASLWSIAIEFWCVLYFSTKLGKVN